MRHREKERKWFSPHFQFQLDPWTLMMMPKLVLPLLLPLPPTRKPGLYVGRLEELLLLLLLLLLLHLSVVVRVHYGYLAASCSFLFLTPCFAIVVPTARPTSTTITTTFISSTSDGSPNGGGEYRYALVQCLDIPLSRLPSVWHWCDGRRHNPITTTTLPSGYYNWL